MNLQTLKIACSSCNMRELCIPTGLDAQELDRIDQLVDTRYRVKRGAALFYQGEKFTSLFAVRVGFFKTCISTEDGRSQVTGFHMSGEVLGWDGIEHDKHGCDAIALEDSEVCVIAFEMLEALSREVQTLQRHVHKIMSREMVHEHSVMLLLGSMHAEERVAAFVLNLIERLSSRGLSQTELLLRMTRQEIGSYLGLTIETVSRAFSKLSAAGILQVKQRDIQILDAQALRRMVTPTVCH
jgi:CRP/FNR family transcriptional regulator, anaerobic regulatory protein